MKFTTKAKVSLIAMAAAASSFLGAAPVQAAENETVKTQSATAPAGFLGGLSNIMKTEDQTLTTFKRGLIEADGKTYYLDEFGQKVTGLVQEEENSYYFDEQGEMVSGFVEIKDKTYYFSKQNGVMLTGEITVGEDSYFLQEDGELLTGFVENEGKTYYYNENGYMTKDTVKKIDGVVYGFDENGVMLTNASKDGYDFDDQGVGTANVSAYQKIADAALAQVGVYQDCTMLVTNALKAVGINFHGWPTDYLSLGPLTSDPVPGDIIVYYGHVAIYIGDGMAVHGGWNGNQTVIWTVECANTLIGYVHPILP